MLVSRKAIIAREARGRGKAHSAVPREGVRTEQARKRRVLGRTESPPTIDAMHARGKTLEHIQA